MRIWFGRLVVVLCCCSNQSTSQQTVPPNASTPQSSGASADPVAAAAQSAPTALLAPVACPSYKSVPTSITKDTVVDGPCIEIKPNTTVTIAQGIHLIVVATSAFRMGDGASIIAVGANGTQGAAATVLSADWHPSEPDQGEKIACACHDTHCKNGWGHCSYGTDANLHGKRGNPGQRGGDLLIVSRQLILGATFKIDVSGGKGGPPGPSGHVNCMWNGDQCSSPSSPNEGDGSPGSAGAASYKAGTTTAAATLAQMATATKLTGQPSGTAQTQVIDTNASLQTAVSDARAQGKSYDNIPGV